MMGTEQCVKPFAWFNWRVCTVEFIPSVSAALALVIRSGRSWDTCGNYWRKELDACDLLSNDILSMSSLLQAGWCIQMRRQYTASQDDPRWRGCAIYDPPSYLVRRRRWRGRRGGRSSSWRQRRSFLSLTPCPLTSLQPITRGDSLPQAAVLQVCSTTPSLPPLPSSNWLLAKLPFLPRRRQSAAARTRGGRLEFE